MTDNRHIGKSTDDSQNATLLVIGEARYKTNYSTLFATASQSDSKNPNPDLSLLEARSAIYLIIAVICIELHI